MSVSSIEQQYYEFHMKLLQNFISDIAKLPPFTLEECEEKDQVFLQNITGLNNLTGEALNNQGQVLLCLVVAGYPHLMPILPRDLLWFFAGDCLQFMPDEEIEQFQALDEKRFAASENNASFAYAEERVTQFGLH